MRVLLRGAKHDVKVTVVCVVDRIVRFTIKIAEQMKELGILGMAAL